MSWKQFIIDTFYRRAYGEMLRSALLSPSIFYLFLFIVWLGEGGGYLFTLIFIDSSAAIGTQKKPSPIMSLNKTLTIII